MSIPWEMPDAEIKACCATAYQSEAARLLLGDAFHPGASRLTEHLGALLALGPGQRVLDVASGQGSSALVLARRFGCQVLGIEYGAEAVLRASEEAAAAGYAHLVTFQQGDAECLPISDGAFDALICECAFCTFPNKAAAAAEFERVLKPGGRLGLSDLTRTGTLPEALRGLLAWIACLADAQPLHDYLSALREAGLTVELVEAHDEALRELVQQVRGRLLAVELLTRLKKIDLPAFLDVAQARAFVSAAQEALQAGRFGYVVIQASKASA
ncbi:MAG TPA: methyltransferase domain-containing protein [Ktedonobacteraceae bacterium]